MVAHIRTTGFLLVLALGTIGHDSTVGLVAAPRAQSTQPFRWEGRLPAGSVLEIKGVNGQIHAGPAAGSGVTVVADRQANRDNPADVAIEVVEHEGGVTICAVYPSRDGSNECRPGSSGRMNVRDNDVRVDFTVQVPAGVHFVGRTVNGDVEIDEVPGNAEAYAVNGSVRLASRGFAQAETVNGSITASLGRADWAHAPRVPHRERQHHAQSAGRRLGSVPGRYGQRIDQQRLSHDGQWPRLTEALARHHWIGHAGAGLSRARAAHGQRRHSAAAYEQLGPLFRFLLPARSANLLHLSLGHRAAPLLRGGWMEGIIRAWGRILQGYAPSLSIEITRECPLRCPGCYAYGEEHLGGAVTLRDVRDFKGQELIDRTLALVDRHRPLHVSIVGGEPLVRYRELNEILPALSARGIYTQVVTSAVRPLPLEWAGIDRLQLVVSIDGLQPEHDERRKPATYDRILSHIKGHSMAVHCTITRQQVRRAGYLEEFLRFWSANPSVRRDLVQSVHAAGGRDFRRETQSVRSRAGRGRAPGSPRPVSEARAAPGIAPGLRDAAAVARRMRVRPDDDVRVGRFRDPNHALSVRRESRLRELRMHGVGRTRRGRAASAARRPASGRDFRHLGKDWPQGCPLAGTALGRPRLTVRDVVT